MNRLQVNKELVAPCGVYCGACPAYVKGTCLGCRSESHQQKRISKWSCPVRDCAIYQKQLHDCGQCNEWICNAYDKKLLKGHENDSRYTYRSEAVQNLKFLKDQQSGVLLQQLKNTYNCPVCEGIITFYNYRCSNCNYELLT